MDLLEPLKKSEAGYRFILVIFDHSNRYPWAISPRTVTTRNIAHEMVKYVIRYGLPHEIHTDQRLILFQLEKPDSVWTGENSIQ